MTIRDIIALACTACFVVCIYSVSTRSQERDELHDLEIERLRSVMVIHENLLSNQSVKLNLLSARIEGSLILILEKLERLNPPNLAKLQLDIKKLATVDQ